MRRSVVVITIAALLLIRVPLQADTLVFSLFSDYLDSLRKQAGIPGLSAAIVGTNDILWEHVYGQQDVERAIAARTDTPYHLDGLTQMLTAALVLGCVESARLSLDDRIGRYAPGSTEPDATLRQLLSHTSASGAFAYRPERLGPLAAAVEACSDGVFRDAVAALLGRNAMMDSVPGVDALGLVPPTPGAPGQTNLDRYRAVIARLAVPYAVDKKLHATPSQYAASALTASGGLVSTVRDYARFDLALRSGVLLRADTLAAAWKQQPGRPYGLGWFVQSYNGEPVVWQFGGEDSAASSMVITLPARGLTLVVLANSDGLVKTFDLASGDVTVSPVARLFLGVFVR